MKFIKILKNNKRLIKYIIIVLLLIICFSLIISKTTYSHGDKQYKIIYVSSGDTLWNIACQESKTNSYYKNKDVRQIINSISKESKLLSSNLQVDQELKIPII